MGLPSRTTLSRRLPSRLLPFSFKGQFYAYTRPVLYDAYIPFSFPDIAAAMATHLRRFVTSPLAIFEFEFASENRAPPPLAAAAKCLALCIEASGLFSIMTLRTLSKI